MSELYFQVTRIFLHNFVIRFCRVSLLTGILLSGINDYKEYRIPNWGSVTLLGIAFISFLSCLAVGKASNINLIIGMIIGLLVLAKLHVIGGGDLKIMMAGCVGFPIPCFYVITVTLTLTTILIMWKGKAPIIFYFSILQLPFYFVF